MVKELLACIAAAHAGIWFGLLIDQASTLLFDKTSQRFLKKRNKSYRSIGTEDMISMLPDALLVKILLNIPTKESVATMILSKRWRYIWTMVPQLLYCQEIKSPRVVIGGLIGRLHNRLFGKTDRQLLFIDKSLQDHNAPILEKLSIELGGNCLVDVVIKWIEKAVDRKVRELTVVLQWSAEPTSLPMSLYACDTLVSLSLAGKILVDVPSLVCFPSLKGLCLNSVMYKDEDSLVRLLSSCPILKHMIVKRHRKDNITNFNIKVPHLKYLAYINLEFGAHGEGTFGTLVIDTWALEKVFFIDYSKDTCSIENKPLLNKARIEVDIYLDNKFMRSLSSLVHLELILNYATLAWFNTINFSQLKECKIIFQKELDWLEPLMVLLQKSPNLKVLCIDQIYYQLEEELLPLTWNQPSYVPECLSSRLEIFEWKGYGGRDEEKEVVRYIFSNSKCLKRAGISFKSNYYRRRKKKIELESLHRVSTSSQLLFSTKLENMSIYDEMDNF
ncbi:unnamed protein product [Cochlearia groenlandica]